MSKIKLVPVPSIKKRELMTALMDGRTFTTKTESEIPGVVHPSNLIHWDDKFGNNPVREGLRAWEWRGFKYLHEITEHLWYEDPDMVGKPVKARDLERDEWTLAYFNGYQKHDNYKFDCAGAQWKYAEPLTAADLYQEQV